jgi:hypothetical protein
MQTAINRALNSSNPGQIFLIFVATLLVVDVVLLLISLALFQRTRLILS